MSLLRRYTTTSLSNLLDEIWSNSPIDYGTTRYYRRDRWIPVTENSGRVEVELAGFNKEQIEVFTENNMVVVSAKDSASRSYYKTWALGENEKVDRVRYENGLLSIEISKVISEDKKRNTYKIE